MAENKILKNSLKDREYNGYIWVNWGIAKMVYPVSWVQKLELILQEKFQNGISWEFYLPWVPYGPVSFYWIDWNGEFWNQTILINQVWNIWLVQNNWDYFIDINWKVTYKSNWTWMLWTIFLTEIKTWGGTTPSLKSNLEKLKTEANDLITEFTYSDIWTSNERITFITYSSLDLELTVWETLEYTEVSWRFILMRKLLS